MNVLPVTTAPDTLKRLAVAISALEATATALERQYGKGSPEAEAVLALFDQAGALQPFRP